MHRGSEKPNDLDVQTKPKQLTHVKGLGMKHGRGKWNTQGQQGGNAHANTTQQERFSAVAQATTVEEMANLNWTWLCWPTQSCFVQVL